MQWQLVDPGNVTPEPGSGVSLVITPPEKNLGAFTVRRALPSPERQRVGPFIFFDQFGPTILKAGQAVDVRPHPHIGLSTISWLFEGEIRHRDSLGFDQVIRPGEVNWMTAGKGIVHSERSPEEDLHKDRPLFGIQTWVALPHEQEACEPSFSHYSADEIPRYSEPGISMALITGSAWGQASPVKTASFTVYAEISLEKGKSLVLPREVVERAVYICQGELLINDQQYSEGTMVVLEEAAEVLVSAKSDVLIVLIGGDPVEGERILEWNFVASTREKIDQARQDWRENRFPKVPGDDEFIPLPE